MLIHVCMSLVVVVPQVMALRWIGLPRSGFKVSSAWAQQRE